MRGSPRAAPRAARSGEARQTGSLNPATRRAFHRDLVRWYQCHRRKLPWRVTRDPYKIWVSEIMLQQTRVEVVRDYYARWLKSFPTLQSLASAPFSRVLKLWEGLGYYSRAKNLHRAAKILAREHQGQLPSSADELRQLPGVGHYTAGAIASIAFGRRAPLVDGNVARVFTRVFNVQSDVTESSTQKLLRRLAEELLPQRKAGTFNQALMELGALVCTPANPQCAACPLASVCRAKLAGTQSKLPIRGAKEPQRLVVHNAAIIQRNGEVLLQQRPTVGLLAGMWQLPTIAGNHRLRRPVVQFRHTITNHKITLRVFACRSIQIVKNPGSRLRWVSHKHLNRLTIPAAHRRALRLLFPEAH